ncbi:MAG: hypothetical protein LQ352_006962 [Teloschistes flavicans]|nr:MAG: hypothetical protein LQ352_006962 [Teloschistes flavicans]
MSVGFGFSVGDFIAAINLVGTVIDALSNSSKSSSELQELLRQLYSLQIALDEVNSIRFSDQLHAELLALRQAAAQCQLTISAFLAQVASYQPHLVGIDGGSNSLQRGWKKIQWAVCKKKDLVQFQTDLSAHTAAIQIILATIQMKNADIDNESQQNLQKSVASQLQEGFSAYMRKFSSITGKLDGMIISMRECLHNTRRIISTNIQVFQVVLEIQNILKTIPGQIERQKPVYLNDALGRYAPFYLEFIMSPEALISVLAINFKSIGRASRKIENGQFIIHDSRTKRDIDLSHPWESCFRPGQRVEMSMVFDTFKAANISCPDCRHPCDINSEEDVEWYASLTSYIGEMLS